MRSDVTTHGQRWQNTAQQSEKWDLCGSSGPGLVSTITQYNFVCVTLAFICRYCQPQLISHYRGTFGFVIASVDYSPPFHISLRLHVHILEPMHVMRHEDTHTHRPPHTNTQTTTHKHTNNHTNIFRNFGHQKHISCVSMLMMSG